jgi:hypothetical protein
MDRDDMGLIQSGCCLGLAAEPCLILRIVGEVRGNTFRATTRFMAVSNALQTSPIPPRPSRSINWYRPNGVPSTG